MADEKYEQKVKDMQKYIPFLENLIQKLKSNKDEKREGQLQKMEMLYGLLTNKDKKLKLETLEKCEAVMVKLYSKVEKDSSTLRTNASESAEMATAPASPSNQEDPNIEYHDPIVIPTERRRSPSPPSLHPIIANNEALFGRPQNIDPNDIQKKLSFIRQSPELFRRRSPNRDRPNQYEELRRKYESPTNQTMNRPVEHLPRPVVPSVRSSGPLPSEVLKSPPISLDDLKDYLDDSDQSMGMANRNLIQNDPRFARNMTPSTYNDRRFGNRIDPRNDFRGDSRTNDFRSDPRLGRQDLLPHSHPGMMRPGQQQQQLPHQQQQLPLQQQQLPHQQQQLPQHLPHQSEPRETVRLAYKYNPHPRREIPQTKPNDYGLPGPPKQDDSRNMNTLPSLNFSDPRLRNRQLSGFPSDMNCSQNPIPTLLNKSVISPVGNMASPMSPLANFDGCNSPIYGSQSFYPNYPQQAMHMQHQMHSNNVFMAQQHRFKPQQQPQPRTYGEYRKIRQCEMGSIRMQSSPNQKFESSPISRGLVPSETTKIAETVTETVPSVLDSLYRNSSFQNEKSIGVQGFKIPKIQKDKPVAETVTNSSKINIKDTKTTAQSNEGNRGKAVASTKGQKDVAKAGEEKRAKIIDRRRSSTNRIDEENKQRKSSIENISDDDEDDAIMISKVRKAKPAQLIDDDENWDDIDEQQPMASSKEKKPDKSDSTDTNLSKSKKKVEVNANSEKIKEKKSNKIGPVRRKSIVNVENLSEQDVDKAHETDTSKTLKKSTSKESEKAVEIKSVTGKPIARSRSKSTADVVRPIISDDEETSLAADKPSKTLKKAVSKENESTTQAKPATGKRIARSRSKSITDAVRPIISDDEETSLAVDKPSKTLKKAVSKENESTTQAKPATGKRIARSRSKSISGLVRPAISDDEENESNKKAKSQKIKRKNVTSDSEAVPDKVAKIVDNSKPVSNEEYPEDDEAATNSASIENDIEMVDGELPDTIINSDISCKNIIEGRRTRNVTRHSLPEETTPAKNTPAKAVPQAKTTPTAKKGRKSAPAAAAAAPAATKTTEQDAEECAVSSTTLETKTEQKKKPVPKGRVRKVVENKTEPAKVEEKPAEEEKPASSSGSSTTTETAGKKDEITKEWLEGFLMNLFNPAQMSTNSVLGMLEKVLDPTKFQQVRKILSTDEAPVEEEQPAASDVANTSKASNETIKEAPSRKGRRKNELDRLNEDIRDMFISKGVVTATGRRMCTALHDEIDTTHSDASSIKSQSTKVATPKSTSATNSKTATSTAAAAKTAAATKSAAALKPPVATLAKTVKGRRGRRLGSKNKKKKRGRPFKITPVVDENAEASEPDMDIDIDGYEPADFEMHYEDPDDEAPLSSKRSTKSRKDSEKEEELMEIVVGKNATLKTNKDGKETIEIMDESDDVKAADSVESKRSACKKVLKVQLTAADLIDPAKLGIGAAMETQNVAKPTEKPPSRKRGRGRPKIKSAASENTVVDFKNIHSEMHTQSEYTKKCVLCNFTGRHMSIHYKHLHRDAEVLISRLPPNAHMRLVVNDGNIPSETLISSPNRTLFTHVCPFCEVQNKFSRVAWFHHFATHTGEYTFKCSDCGHMMNYKTEINKHIQKKCPKAQPIRQRTFLGNSRAIQASICELCNYIQMEKPNVIKHLQTQHDCTEEMITEIVLLHCNPSAADTESKDANKNASVEASKTTLAKDEKLAIAEKPDPILSSIEKPTTDSDQIMQVFMPNEKNDVNIDSNIMQFMRDLSFSAPGSPPRSTAMTVADRINERFRNVDSLNSAAENASSTANELRSKPIQSMVDRLSKRFSEANSSQASTSTSIDDIKAPVATTSADVTMQNDVEEPSKIQQSEDDDCIIISDGEEKNVTAKSNQKFPVDGITRIKIENELPIKIDSDEDAADNDDEDWEDIDAPLSPSCIENEPKSSTTEKKKNKTIFATLSRLYATMVQPKAKKKTDMDSKSAASSPCSTTTSNTDHIDRKKLETSGMHRVDSLGFSKKQGSDAVKYHCLVNKCSFLYSDIPDGLEVHVLFEHSNLIWNGFCQICDEQVVTDPDTKLIQELRHMQQVHVKKPPIGVQEETVTADEEIKELTMSTGLKIRRLSGDTLSAAQAALLAAPVSVTPEKQTLSKPLSPSPLQIASAVSLNKASDIWKPLNTTSPDRSQQKTVPIVIKQVFSRGSPSLVIQQTNTSPDAAAAAPSTSMPTLKIAKVTSIAGPKTAPSSPSTSPTVSAVATAAQITQPKNYGAIISTSDHTGLKISDVTSGVLLTNHVEPRNSQESNNASKAIPTQLKPWTVSRSVKTDSVVAQLQRDLSLFAFFKCMGNDCAFTTSMAEKMVQHLNYHALQQHRSRTEVNAYTWLECCYCSFRAGKISDLIKHMNDKHGRDIFQCPYCFYRSCDENNVIIHLRQHHPLNEIAMLLCSGEKPTISDEFDSIKNELSTHLRRLICIDCPETYMNIDDFTLHLKHHSDPHYPKVYKCAHCLPISIQIATNMAQPHLALTHQIGFFECVYCVCGLNEKTAMLNHLSTCHPSSLAFCYVRQTTLLTQEETYAKSENGKCAIALFSAKAGEHLIRICPYTKQELSSMNSGLIVAKEAQNIEASKIKILSINEKPLGFEIANVQSIAPQPATVQSSPVAAAATAAATVATAAATTAAATTAAASATTAAAAATTIAAAAPTTVATTTAAADNVAMQIVATADNVAIQIIATAENERQSKILAAAEDIVNPTGVYIDELYRCGMLKCFYHASILKDFRMHLTQSHTAVYSCFYCDLKFTRVLDCINHYSSHERHRYFCFSCFKTAVTANVLAAHLAQDHAIRNKHSIVTYALIKGKINARRDFFFVCPNNVNTGEILRFGDRLLKHYEKSKWSQMKKSFTVDEIEKLPRQAIFLEELSCGICQYRTKVRTNLVRHLQFHRHEIDVASIDPVNPVPCLNSNERHFDKMTNLACSSHESKLLTGTASGNIKISPTKSSESIEKKKLITLPKFVPISKRFVCGVDNCRATMTSEAIMKQHLVMTHANTTSYKCPHCNILICANKICVDKIAIHLKFHDSMLYQCRRCDNLHYHKPIMDRHVNEKHPGEKEGYHIIMRNEDGTTKILTGVPTSSAASLAASSAPMKWLCSLCKARTATQNQMNLHINDIHNIKYRYQCSKCNFGGALLSAISDHAAKKHTNKLAEVLCYYTKLPDTVTEEVAVLDTTPLWRRDPNKIKNIRGILMEEEPSSTATATSPVNPAAVADEAETIESEQSELPSNPPVIQPSTSQNITHLPVKAALHNFIPCDKCSLLTFDDMNNHIIEMHWAYENAPEALSKLFKFGCYYCKSSFAGTLEFRKHWLQIHRLSKFHQDHVNDDMKGRPPWFYVAKRYQCLRCIKCDDYRGIGIHHFLEHPDETFAIKDIENFRKCGHCSFTFKPSNKDELAAHYQTEHPLTNHKLPIPSKPPIDLSPNLLTKFLKVGHRLQSYRCNLCSMILVGKDAYEYHLTNSHANNENASFTLLETLIYKCPTCLYNSHEEADVCQHILEKIIAGKFEIPTEPASIDVSNEIWPYLSIEIVFPNGFVVKKCRLLKTPYGGIDTIKKFVETKIPIVEALPSNAADTTSSALTENQNQSENVAGNLSDQSNNSTDSTNRSKRRKRPSTKMGSIDQFESDDEYEPSKPKKRSKKMADDNGSSTKEIEQSSSDNIKPLEPFSVYGTKPDDPDLTNVIANIIIDGVKVMIPANDFNKIYKKDIAIKLQKIEETVSGTDVIPTKTDGDNGGDDDHQMKADMTELPEQLLADSPKSSDDCDRNNCSTDDAQQT